MGHRVIEEPWFMVGADIMGPYTPSFAQHRYVFVFQDFLTRWIEVLPLRNANGATITKAFKDLITNRWGTAKFLFTDNGTEFHNKVVDHICQEYAIKRVKTSLYSPQAKSVKDLAFIPNFRLKSATPGLSSWEAHAYLIRASSFLECRHMVRESQKALSPERSQEEAFGCCT